MYPRHCLHFILDFLEPITNGEPLQKSVILLMKTFGEKI